jgi:predicted RNase H-like HicB family nuclease
VDGHYSMVIEWSDEDQAYLVTLPEWADRVKMPCADGETYEEAARVGAEVLDELLYLAEQQYVERPIPRVYATAS